MNAKKSKSAKEIPAVSYGVRTGWGTGLTNWTYCGHIMIWMQQSYCKEVRHATTSQTGSPPASPELAMAGRRREPCIMSLSGELSAKR